VAPHQPNHAEAPRLDQVDQHTLSDRGAMELPECYLGTACEDIGAEVEALRAEPVGRWLALVENVDAPLPVRFAAGALLGLRGDPRLAVDRPAMVDVPGGRVRLGLDPAQVDAVTARWARYGVRREWIEKEAPEFELELRLYRIGKYPVTHREYLEFLRDTQHPELPTSWVLGRFPLHLSNHPVHTLSADAADAYAAWLARRTGRRFRLPTEAEWEHAAAGPQRREFPWGDELDPERANTVELRLLSTTPVGLFPRGASPFGALDMGGNVEEYVADDYRPYPGARRIDDDLTRDGAGTYRVARGGSFTRFADLARCRRRHGRYRGALYVVGLRLAEDV
jgi:formylglycine-generating enzyme required for sulfatase activity